MKVIAISSLIVLLLVLLSSQQCSADETWGDSPYLTDVWKLISSDDSPTQTELMLNTAEKARLRSSDGRGPLFWAYEYNRLNLIAYLLERGSDPYARDVSGKTPADMATSPIDESVIESLREGVRAQLANEAAQAESTPKSEQDDDDDDDDDDD